MEKPLQLSCDCECDGLRGEGCVDTLCVLIVCAGHLEPCPLCPMHGSELNAVETRQMSAAAETGQMSASGAIHM